MNCEFGSFASRGPRTTRVWLASVVAVWLVLWCDAAQAAVRRYAVVVGNNLGHHDEIPLRHAERDARRMYDVLLELGGGRAWACRARRGWWSAGGSRGFGSGRIGHGGRR